jgi:hypothetical protein
VDGENSTEIYENHICWARDTFLKIQKYLQTFCLKIWRQNVVTDWRDNFRTYFRATECGMTTGFIWLSIESFRCHYCTGRGIIFSPMPPHVHIDIVVTPPPSDYGRNVTDIWGWGAHGSQLLCPNDVSGDTWSGVPVETLSLPSTNYPEQGHHRDRPLWEKSPQKDRESKPGPNVQQSWGLTTWPRGTSYILLILANGVMLLCGQVSDIWPRGTNGVVLSI